MTEVLNSNLTAGRRQQFITPDDLQDLTLRSDREGLWRLAQHLLTLLVLAWLMTTVPDGFRWIPGGFYCAFLVFSFCPLHESIHGSLFATRWLNQSTGFILGLLLVLPPKYFNGFHMAHHRFTQLPGKDPELATPKPETLRAYLWQISGIPYAIAETKMLVRGSFGMTDEFIPQRQQSAVIMEARVFLAIYSVILMFSLWSQSLFFWWFWLLPLLIGQPLLRLFLMAEHTGCERVDSMLRNTRTTFSNRAMTWFCWNMNHHTAHHAYAGVPFFRLSQVTEKLLPKIAMTDYGYIAVNRSIVMQLRKS